MSRILVVDDDASHRELMCELLEEMGYQTAQASNGKEALDQLEGELPSGVLLDLRMPVMSGWALLEAMKRLPRARELPIIIISAYGFEWEAELVGAAGFVGKPVDIERVRRVVHQIIGEPQCAQLH
jgi:CheY-like chemotaxis protein